MPLDPVTGTIILAGSQAAGAGLNALTQYKMNQKNIAFQREMNQLQRNWSLEDWHMTNAYNHPSQQMQRFKEAGLNPHLIYGKGETGNATMVRGPEARAPKSEGEGYFSAVEMLTNAPQQIIPLIQLENQTRLTEAQILKMKADTDRTDQQIKLTQANWDDLITAPTLANQLKLEQGLLAQKQRQSMPEPEIAKKIKIETFLSQKAKTDAQAAHALELFKLAEKENALKGMDLDLMQKLMAGPMGIRYIIQLIQLVRK